jgi:hypothetical protein
LHSSAGSPARFRHFFAAFFRRQLHPPLTTLPLLIRFRHTAVGFSTFSAFFAVFRRFCFAFNPKSYTFLHFPTLSYTHETRSPSNFPTLSYTSYTSYTFCFSFTPGSLCISYTYRLPPSPHQVRTKFVGGVQNSQCVVLIFVYSFINYFSFNRETYFFCL